MKLRTTIYSLLLLALFLIVTGCARTEKGVKIYDSHVNVWGDIDPSFLRENTSESQAQDTKPSLEIPVFKKE